MIKFKTTPVPFWKGHPYIKPYCDVCGIDFLDLKLILRIEDDRYTHHACSTVCVDAYVLQHMDDKYFSVRWINDTEFVVEPE